MKIVKNSEIGIPELLTMLEPTSCKTDIRKNTYELKRTKAVSLRNKKRGRFQLVRRINNKMEALYVLGKLFPQLQGRFIKVKE